MLAGVLGFVVTLDIYGSDIYHFTFIREIFPPFNGTLYGDATERVWFYNITVGFFATLWLALIATFFLAARKNIRLSLILLIAPVIFAGLLLLYRFQKISDLTDSYLQEIRLERPLYPFELSQLFLFAFLIFVVLWHTKILIQDRMRAVPESPELL